MSWNTILRKRENFRQAFDNFEIEVVAGTAIRKFKSCSPTQGSCATKPKLTQLSITPTASLNPPGICSLDDYLWDSLEGNHQNSWQTISQIPATSPISDAMSKIW